MIINLCLQNGDYRHHRIARGAQLSLLSQFEEVKNTFFFLILCAGVNPCHVGKTFAPQLWFAAGYCRGSGISLMK